MPLDVSLKKIDLIALHLDDIFYQVTNRNDTYDFVIFNNWQVPDMWGNSKI